MNYSEYVNSHNAHNFHDFAKTALDLAMLLDHEFLQIDPEKMDAYALKNKVALRKRVFDVFCYMCHQAPVTVPPLEAVFYDLKQIKKPKSEDLEKATELSSRITKKIQKKKKTNEAKQLFALMEVVTMFPHLTSNQYGMSLESSDVSIVVNDLLVKLGFEPIRMNYGEIKFKSKMTEQAAPKGTKVLIVDDSLEEIVNTILAGLAGWYNVEIELMLVQPVDYYADAETKEKWLKDMAQRIVDTKANFVLMDQGLGKLNGSDIVRTIFADNPNPDMVFVPNTGGEPNELIEAGSVRGNFEKGRSRRTLHAAFRG